MLNDERPFPSSELMPRTDAYDGSLDKTNIQDTHVYVHGQLMVHNLYAMVINHDLW